MTVFLLILGILLLIAGFVLFGILLSRTTKMREKKYDYDRSPENVKKVHRQYPIKKAPLILCLIGIAGIIASQSFAIVPTGYTGVRTTFGLIDQESCMPGFNGLVPFVQHISLVNNKQQDVRFDSQIWSETSEQTVLYMQDVAVSYQIMPESSAWIYANVDNWIEKLIDVDIVSSSLKAASRSLTADVVTDRSVIEPLAKESLQAAVDAKYGTERVLIKNVIINQMDFEDSYNQAIAEKSEAIQQQQKQAILNQTAIEKATSDAEAKRIAAQGDADAERIRAEGKAEANKIISNSITPATQKQDAIDKWNGTLPKYVGGSEDTTFGILDAAGDTVPE